MSSYWQSMSGADGVMWTPALVILAKATALLLVALAVTLIMRRASAVSRHLVLFVSLAALLLIPALGVWSPVRLAILPAAWSAGAKESATRATVGAADANGSLGISRIESSSVGVNTRQQPVGVSDATFNATFNGTRNEEKSGSIDWSRLTTVMFVVWGAVALAFTAWLTIGLVVVHRIVRRATTLEGTPLQSTLLNLADRMSLDEAPRLLISDAITMPFACGVRTPTVVLPRDAQSWNEEQRTAVLLHELAHIKRRDLIGHTVSRFACAMYWFHPLVWTAARKLRAESERACDDLALICGARPSDYAEHLLNIVTRVKHRRTPPLALAMATRSEFEGRMLAILDPERRRRGPGRVQSVALMTAVIGLAVVIGIATPAASSAAIVRAQAAKQSVTDSVRRTKSGKPSGVVGVVDAPDVAPVSDTQSAIESQPRKRATARDLDDRELTSSVNTEISTTISNAIRTQMQTNVNQSVNPYLGATVNSVLSATIGALSGRGARIGADSNERALLLSKVLRTESSPEVRRVAAWGLEAYASDPTATEALAQAARKDSSSSVREMAAWALAQSDHSPAAYAALIEMVRGERVANVRQTAVWSLAAVSSSHDPQAEAAILDLLADRDAAARDPRVREEAAWAIGTLSPRHAPPAVVALLADSSPKVRMTTAWALSQIGDAAASTALDVAIRTETNHEVQRAMVRALGAMGDASVSTIKRLLDSSDADVRAIAIRALAGGQMNAPWPQPRPRPRPFP